MTHCHQHVSFHTSSAVYKAPPLSRVLLAHLTCTITTINPSRCPHNTESAAFRHTVRFLSALHMPNVQTSCCHECMVATVNDFGPNDLSCGPAVSGAHKSTHAASSLQHLLHSGQANGWRDQVQGAPFNCSVCEGPKKVWLTSVPASICSITRPVKKAVTGAAAVKPVKFETTVLSYLSRSTRSCMGSKGRRYHATSCCFFSNML